MRGVVRQVVCEMAGCGRAALSGPRLVVPLCRSIGPGIVLSRRCLSGLECVNVGEDAPGCCDHSLGGVAHDLGFFARRAQCPV